MGRHKLTNLEELVQVCEENNKAKCLKCDKKLKNHAGNIKRHYATMHRQNFNEIKENFNHSPSKKPKLQSVTLQMDQNQYQKAIAKSVSHLHLPLRFFDDEVFQQLLQPWTSAYGMAFNSKSITNHISAVTNVVRLEIVKAISKKFVCLKLDIATRMDRSIMGINIQFIQDFKIVVYTIGMIELTERHTALYLKEKVLDILQKYNIDISQVYSITTDNGANVIKASKLLKEFHEYGILNDEQSDEDISEHNEDIEFFEAVSHKMLTILSVVHCAAHTLQLASWDVMKKIKYDISKCREAVKALRKKMRKLNISPIPFLDNSTRWSSTYEMVKSILKVEQTICTNPHLNTDIDWEFAKKFHQSFKPLAEATTMLQSQQLIMGDFYREWLLCETEIEEILSENEIASYLLEALNVRKQILMENNAFLAALYMDPRFCYRGSTYLSDEQKKLAISHLLMIHRKLKSFGEINDYTQNKASNEPKNETNSRYEKLEKKVAVTCVKHSDSVSIKDDLEQLQYGEKISFDTNVLDFWKSKFIKDLTIGKIAEVALAVPATQVSVERSFSALPIVMTKNRRNLSPENLENILLLRLNPDLIDKVVM